MSGKQSIACYCLSELLPETLQYRGWQLKERWIGSQKERKRKTSVASDATITNLTSASRQTSTEVMLTG